MQNLTAGRSQRWRQTDATMDIESLGEISVSSSIERQAMREQLDAVRQTLNSLATGAQPGGSGVTGVAPTGFESVLSDIASKLTSIEGIYSNLTSKLEKVDSRVEDSERHIKDLQHFSASTIHETARLVDYVGGRGTPNARASSLAGASPAGAGTSAGAALRARHMAAAAGGTSTPPHATVSPIRTPVAALEYVPGHMTATIQQHAAQIHKLIAGLDFLEAHIIRQDQVVEGLQKSLTTIAASHSAAVAASESRSPSELSLRVHDMAELLNKLRAHMYKVEKKASSTDQTLAALAERLQAVEMGAATGDAVGSSSGGGGGRVQQQQRAAEGEVQSAAAELAAAQEELRTLVLGLGRDVEQLRDQVLATAAAQQEHQQQQQAPPPPPGVSAEEGTEMRRQLTYLMSQVPTLVVENTELRQFAARATQQLDELSAAQQQREQEHQQQQEAAAAAAAAAADDVAQLSATVASLQEQVAGFEASLQEAATKEELVAAAVTAAVDAAQDSAASTNSDVRKLEIGVTALEIRMEEVEERVATMSIAAAAEAAAAGGGEVEAAEGSQTQPVVVSGMAVIKEEEKEEGEDIGKVEGKTVGALPLGVPAAAVLAAEVAAAARANIEEQFGQLRHRVELAAEAAAAAEEAARSSAESAAAAVAAAEAAAAAVAAASAEQQEAAEDAAGSVADGQEGSSTSSTSGADFAELRESVLVMVAGVEQEQATLKQQLAFLTAQISEEQAAISAGLEQVQEQVAAAAAAAAEAASCAQAVQEQQAASGERQERGAAEALAAVQGELAAVQGELREQVAGVMERLKERVELGMQQMDSQVTALSEQLSGALQAEHLEAAVQDLRSALSQQLEAAVAELRLTTSELLEAALTHVRNSTTQQLQELQSTTSEQLDAAMGDVRSATSEQLENALADVRSATAEQLQAAMAELGAATADVAERYDMTSASLEDLRSELILLIGQQDVVLSRLGALEAAVGIDPRVSRHSGRVSVLAALAADAPEAGVLGAGGDSDAGAVEEQARVMDEEEMRAAPLFPAGDDASRGGSTGGGLLELVAELRSRVGGLEGTVQAAAADMEQVRGQLQGSAQEADDKIQQATAQLLASLQGLSAAVEDMDGRVASTAAGFEAVAAAAQRQVADQAEMAGALEVKLEEVQVRLETEVIARVQETSAAVSSLSARLARDYINREQLGAIFQARADMKRAVDELATVFNTGRLLRAGSSSFEQPPHPYSSASAGAPSGAPDPTSDGPQVLSPSGGSGTLSPRLVSALEDLAGKQAELEHQVKLALYRTEGAVRQEELRGLQQAMMTLELQFRRLGAASPPATTAAAAGAVESAAPAPVPPSAAEDAAPAAAAAGLSASELAALLARVEALEVAVAAGAAAQVTAVTTTLEAQPADDMVDAEAIAVSDNNVTDTEPGVHLSLAPEDPADANSPVRVRLTVGLQRSIAADDEAILEEEEQDSPGTPLGSGPAEEAAAEPSLSAMLLGTGATSTAATSASTSPVKSGFGQLAPPPLLDQDVLLTELHELRRAVAELASLGEGLQQEVTAGAADRQRLAETLATEATERQQLVEALAEVSERQRAVEAVVLDLAAEGAERQKLAEAVAAAEVDLKARLREVAAMEAAERQHLADEVAAEVAARERLGSEMAAAVAEQQRAVAAVSADVAAETVERERVAEAVADLTERLDSQVNAAASNTAMLATMATDQHQQQQQVRLTVRVGGPEAEDMAAMAATVSTLTARLDAAEDALAAAFVVRTTPRSGGGGAAGATRQTLPTASPTAAEVEASETDAVHVDEVPAAVPNEGDTEGVAVADVQTEGAEAEEDLRPALGLMVPVLPREVEQQLAALAAEVAALGSAVGFLSGRVEGLEAADALEEVRAAASQVVLEAIPGLVSERVAVVREEMAAMVAQQDEELVGMASQAARDAAEAVLAVREAAAEAAAAREAAEAASREAGEAATAAQAAAAEANDCRMAAAAAAEEAAEGVREATEAVKEAAVAAQAAAVATPPAPAATPEHVDGAAKDHEDLAEIADAEEEAEHVVSAEDSAQAARELAIVAAREAAIEAAAATAREVAIEAAVAAARETATEVAAAIAREVAKEAATETAAEVAAEMAKQTATALAADVAAAVAKEAATETAAEVAATVAKESATATAAEIAAGVARETATTTAAEEAARVVSEHLALYPLSHDESRSAQLAAELKEVREGLASLGERVADVDALRDQLIALAVQVREAAEDAAAAVGNLTPAASSQPPSTPTAAAVASIFTPAPSSLVFQPAAPVAVTPRTSIGAGMAASPSTGGARPTSTPGGAAAPGSAAQTTAQQAAFLARMVAAVKGYSNRLHAQYSDAEETDLALAQVDTSLEEVQGRLAEVRDPNSPAFAEALVMILEQVATLRYIGSQTHPAVQQMVLEHENRLDQLTEQVKAAAAGSTGGSAAAAGAAATAAVADRIAQVEAEIGRIAGQQAALDAAVTEILAAADALRQQAAAEAATAVPADVPATDAPAAHQERAEVTGDAVPAGAVTTAAAAVVAVAAPSMLEGALSSSSSAIASSLELAALAAKVRFLDEGLAARLAGLRQEILAEVAAAVAASDASDSTADAIGSGSGGAAASAAAAAANGVDVSGLDGRVTQLHSAWTALRNRVLAMQEYVDSTQSMIKDMHVALGGLHRRIDSLEGPLLAGTASGGGGTGGGLSGTASGRVSARVSGSDASGISGLEPSATAAAANIRELQTDVAKLESRLLSLEASSIDVAHSVAGLKNLAPRVTETETRLADACGKVAAALGGTASGTAAAATPAAIPTPGPGVSLPAVAGAVRALERRVGGRLEAACGALDSLAAALSAAGRIQAESTANPFKAISAAVKNPVVVALEEKMEAMRATVEVAVGALLEDLRRDQQQQAFESRLGAAMEGGSVRGGVAGGGAGGTPLARMSGSSSSYGGTR